MVKLKEKEEIIQNLQKDIKNNKIINIYLNNDKEEKTIRIDNNRLRYTNEK